MEKKPQTVIKESCPILYALDMVGGKWHLPVICQLDRSEALRYGQLKRQVPGITDMMLSQTLKDLESRGFIQRIQFNEIPPHTEYSLTSLGRSILPELYRFAQWGRTRMLEQDIQCQCEGTCTVALTEAAITDEDIIRAPEIWEREYQNILAEMKQAPDFDKQTGLAKLQNFCIRVNEVLTQNDYEYTRLTYLMMFNSKGPQLSSQNRVYYEVIRDFIEEGKADGSITCGGTVEDLVKLVASLGSGLIVQWYLDRDGVSLTEGSQSVADTFFQFLK